MREKLYTIIKKAEPGDKISKVYDIFIVIVALLSVVPLMFKAGHPMLDLLDIITLYILFADYIFRWITHDINTDKMGVLPFIKYPFTPFALLALISLLPSMGILGPGFRVLRLFRIVTIFHYSENFSRIADVFKKQKKTLLSVMWIAIFYIFVSALVMFAYEPDTFNSFFDALYWSTTALTTIGYGDMYPVSDIGKLISMVSSIFGIAVIALPAGIITTGFVDEVSRKKEAAPDTSPSPPANALETRPKVTGKAARYAVVMAIGVLMNLLLNVLAQMLNLPLWLDTTGTIFVSLALEPAAGLLVGLVNNLILSIAEFGTGSLLYYSVSAAIALIAGLLMKKGGKITIGRIIISAAIMLTVSTLFAGTTDIILDMGAPPSTYWENYYYGIFTGINLPHTLSYYLSEFVVKLYDTLASIAIALVAYFMVPLRYRGSVEKI